LSRQRHTLNHRWGKPVQEFVINNFALDRKIKEVIKGLPPSPQWMLMEFSDEDKELIANFFLDWSNYGDGTELTPNSKRIYIHALTLLSRYVKDVRNGGVYKSLKEMTRDDFLSDQDPERYGYLRSIRKKFEEDPDENWVNTYNTKGARYLAFWKWLTQCDLPKEERQTPPQLKGYRTAKHKSKRKTRIKQLRK
jgi:hypothetical protein